MHTKLHPTDVAARIIGAREPFRDRAVPRERSLREGRCRDADRGTESHFSLRAKAAENGRTAMIYAVTTEDRLALVTPAPLPAMETNPVQI